MVATDRSRERRLRGRLGGRHGRALRGRAALLQVIVPQNPPGTDAGAARRPRASYAAEDLKRLAQELAGERGRAKVVVDEDAVAGDRRRGRGGGGRRRRRRQRRHERTQGVPARQRAEPRLAQRPLHGRHREQRRGGRPRRRAGSAGCSGGTVSEPRREPTERRGPAPRPGRARSGASSRSHGLRGARVAAPATARATRRRRRRCAMRSRSSARRSRSSARSSRPGPTCSRPSSSRSWRRSRTT